MRLRDVETQQDYIEYFESLLDYLDSTIPCLDELIAEFEMQEDD